MDIPADRVRLRRRRASSSGPNPPEAATITYYLKKRHLFGDLKLEIYDAEGKLITTLPGGKRRGINRVDWPMRAQAAEDAGGDAFAGLFSLFGPRVAGGHLHGQADQGQGHLHLEVTLVPDPRSKDTRRGAQGSSGRRCWKLYGDARAAHRDRGPDVDAARPGARRAPRGCRRATRCGRRLEALADELEKQRTALVATKQGEGGISGEEKLREELGTLYGNVNGYEGRPTQSQLDRMGCSARTSRPRAASSTRYLDKELAALDPLLKKAKLEPIARPKRS